MQFTVYWNRFFFNHILFILAYVQWIFHPNAIQIYSQQPISLTHIRSMFCWYALIWNCYSISLISKYAELTLRIKYRFGHSICVPFSYFCDGRRMTDNKWTMIGFLVPKIASTSHLNHMHNVILTCHRANSTARQKHMCGCRVVHPCELTILRWSNWRLWTMFFLCSVLSIDQKNVDLFVSSDDVRAFIRFSRKLRFSGKKWTKGNDRLLI